MKEPKPDGQMLLSEVNALLRCVGVRRSAEVLVSLIGIVGLRVLALEVCGNVSPP